MAISAAEAEGLCQELAPTLYRLALARSRQPADAEDLVQETLLRLLRALERGDQIGNPLHWSLRVVSNAVKRRGRHGWRTRELDGNIEPLNAASAAADEIVQTRLSNALVAISRLRPRDRAQVIAADLQDWTDAELAPIFGCSASGARMRVLRSRAELALAYLRHAVGFDPQTSACEAAGTLLPRYCAENLDPRRSAALELHLSSCEACARARDDVRQLLRDAIPALFPALDDEQRRRLSARLVAAWLLIQKQRGRPRPLTLLWFKRGASDAHRRRRAALSLLVLLLLIALFGVTPHAIATPPIALAVKGLRIVASPAALGSAAPPQTAMPRPSPALALPSTPPAPAVVDLCPAGSTGAYAYLDKGEVYLRSRIGAPAQQLTNTGGLVDYYWWSPDGQLIAYKTASSGSALGTVSILELASRQVIATLSTQAIFFSFSPDGASWVSAAPIVQSAAYQGQPGFSDFQVNVGAVASGTASKSFTVAGIPGDVEPWPGNYAEKQQYVSSIAANEPWGVYWLSDAIYIDQGMGGQMVHSFTPTGDSPSGWSMQNQNLALQNRFWSVTADSAFALHPASGDPNLYLTCDGRRSIIWQPQIAGPAWTLSVSPDGRSALITDAMVYPCRNDNYLVTADRVVSKLDSDCYSSLARWQP